MKNLVLCIALVTSFSALADVCQIKIERNGIASQDILHRGEVMIEKGAQFGFVRHYKEEITLDDCIKLAIATNPRTQWAYLCTPHFTAGGRVQDPDCATSIGQGQAVGLHVDGQGDVNRAGGKSPCGQQPQAIGHGAHVGRLDPGTGTTTH